MRYLCIGLLALLLLWGCQKEQPETVKLQITLAEMGHSHNGKTYIYQNSDNVFISCWAPTGSVEELIRVNDRVYPVSVPAANASSSAHASINDVETSTDYYAIYPSHLTTSPATSCFSVNIPKNDTFQCINYSNKDWQLVNLPMAGRNDGNDLTIRPLEGVLTFNLTGSGWLEYIEITTGSSTLWGPGTVAINENDVQLSLSESSAAYRTKRLVGIHKELNNDPQPFSINLPTFTSQNCTIVLGIRQTETGVTHAYRHIGTGYMQQAQILTLSLNCPNGVPTGYSEFSDGTAQHPYIITNSNISALTSNATNNKHFILDADLNLTSTATIASFNGVLNGNGHTLTINKPLIQKLSGTIRNLTTTGSLSNTSNASTLGPIAQTVLSGATIEYCTNNANITSTSGDSYVGGICGTTAGGLSINHCTNNGTITSNGNYTGGIVGNCGIEISHCINNGSINVNTTNSSAIRYIGGIAGKLTHSINDCHNTGTIIDSRTSIPSDIEYIGGICASLVSTTTNPHPSMTNCSNKGTMTTSINKCHIGGLVGHLKDATISNCFAACNITAFFCGGLADYNDSDGIIQNCYYYGTISCSSTTYAGLSRFNGSTLSYSYCPSGYDFTKSQNSTISNCLKLTNPTTIEGGDDLATKLNSNITTLGLGSTARRWRNNNGTVEFE